MSTASSPEAPAAPLPLDVSAFHSQFEHIANPQTPSSSHAGPQHQQQQPPPPSSFDMGSMTAALPHQTQQHSMGTSGPYSRQDIPVPMAPSFQLHPGGSQHSPGRQAHFDPAAMARFQQQQFMGHQYITQPLIPQRSPINSQAPGQFGHMEPYPLGINPLHIPYFDPRFANHQPFGINPAFNADMSQYIRRATEPAPVPTFPRGPPRKPKQSGHALWVGNLPPAATVTDLKDHFSREATRDIESLFLISKSNCAFVNYKTEAACIAAMNRFHDSRFNGVRLVCRLRRNGPGGSGTPEASATPPDATPTVAEDQSSPTIVGSPVAAPTLPSLDTTSTKNDEADRALEKFFIVKSLTVQDLEASVRNGVWATQSHNEEALNRAYEAADNVYLIFSANKSGEYFGYARMVSTIAGEPVNLNSSTTVEEPLSPGAPQSIPTPATANAPKGRIIDDSARGTIFWEAEHSDSEREESPDKETGERDGQNWGRQFSIEWLSTTRLPFYRTRGLRNPWNANREVKIARDGTELEPSIGRRLVQMFHRQPPSPNPAHHPGMAYQ